MAALDQQKTYHLVFTFSDADDHAAFVAAVEAKAGLSAGEFGQLLDNSDDGVSLSSTVQALVLASLD
jgi:hypothetical protein